MSADDLPVISADWNAPPHVKAFNTTRQGGVSAPPFHSLNLGLHVNDDAHAVRENRARLRTRHDLPSEPHWLHQVHGRNVLDASRQSNLTDDNDAGVDVDADMATVGAGAANKPRVDTADAAFTNEKDRVLCVVTADCLPVVMTNGDGTELAVAHAGWKGLINGVLEASLLKFSPTDRIHVWMGPAIGPKKFEVGLEVKEAFVARDPAHASAFIASDTHENKAIADIYTLARQTVQRQLSTLRTDVSISGGDRCTFTEDQWFHSYRRDGTASGRMALVAWLAS